MLGSWLTSIDPIDVFIGFVATIAVIIKFFVPDPEADVEYEPLKLKSAREPWGPDRQVVYCHKRTRVWSAYEERPSVN